LSLSAPLDPRLRRGILALWTLVLLIPALSILGQHPIYGDDHSSHMVAIHHLLRLLHGRQTDLFSPTFNLGFPMYLYYQPLPHLCVAAFHILSFGLLSEQLAFNLSVVVLWCCYPLAVYVGARRLELGDTAALLSAICAPLVSASLPFGFTLHSVMGLGLYTQTYAMVLLPLALGQLWQAMHHRASTVRAAGLVVLVSLAHVFYGIVLLSTLVLMLLVVPSRLRSPRTYLPTLVRIGLLVAASLLFVLVPLFLTRHYMGGWPWGGVDRWQGYGLLHVGRELLLGRLLDEHQLPVLTLGLWVGLGLALVGWRHSPTARLLALAFGLFLMFLIGRRTFGHLVDIQPANLGIQLFRYIGPVHLVAVLLSGIGLAWLLQRGAALLRSHAKWRPAPLILLALLLGLPAAHLIQRSRAMFHTNDGYFVSGDDLRRVAQALRQARRDGMPAGRVYVHTKSGLGTHLVSALLGLCTDQPLGQSYGVGLHDSLGFFFLEYLDPSHLDLMALYDFRYVVASPRSELVPKLTALGARTLLRRKHIMLLVLPGRYGYFQAVPLGPPIPGPARASREAALSWLRSDRSTYRPIGQVGPTPPGAAKGTASPGGVVLTEGTALNRYDGRVRMSRPGMVLLKVAYHPFWHATVDRRPVQTTMLTPCFIGVAVPAGEHRIELRFVNPPYHKLLLLGTVLLWIGLGLWRVRRRKAAASPDPPLHIPPP